MAANEATLYARMELRLADAEKKLAKFQANVDGNMSNMERRTKKAAQNVETSMAAMSAKLGGVFNRFGAQLAAGLAAIGGAQAFQAITDSATKIRNSLSVAGLSGEELESTFNKLYESAQRNSVPITSLAELYSRVALNQKELGVSSEQLIGLTDNVGKALRVSGSDAASASGALLQLAQALGSSKIQAEEYNSLIDGMPALLQAAASGIDQAGGSVSKLTQLVKTGKISNKAFFDGIEAGAGVLDQRLASSTQTVAQRTTNLYNSLIKAGDRFNENTKASAALGGEFDKLAGTIDKLDFTGLTEDLQKIVSLLDQGGQKAQAFGEFLGKLTGLREIGASLVDGLGGENGEVSYLGGLVTLKATATEAGKLKENAEIRLSLEQQIKALQDAPPSEEVNASIRKAQAQLAGLPTTTPPAGAKREPSLSTPDYALPGGSPLPPKQKVDITEDRYKVVDDEKAKKARKGRLDDYEREIKQINDRTTSLQAETSAQAAINPLINDYGFQVEKARAKQELLTAAQEAGKKVTPELAAEIETLSTNYAMAVVASEKLAEKQDEIRERAQAAMDTAKDVTRGVIDGFIAGAKAGDILVGSLKKIGDALINDVLNNIFKIGNAGGGGTSFLGTIHKLGVAA